MSAISNLNGIFTGSSIFVFNIGIDVIAYSILTLFFVLGLINVVQAYSNRPLFFPMQK
jgi:hypothetical protein